MNTYIGTAEVARICGVSRQRLDDLARQDRLPKPDAMRETAAGLLPLWRRTTIEKWAKTRRRVPGPVPA